MEDAEVPPSPVCIHSHSKLQPHSHSLPSVSCRYDGSRKTGAVRRSGRLQFPKAQAQAQEEGENGESVQRRTRTMCSPAKRERSSRKEQFSTERTGSKLIRRKAERRRGHKVKLTALPSQTEDGDTGNTGPEIDLSDPIKDTETTESPESPPPVKGWVIGPLLQSFKSKMASFTEIVMSPVRLFKPNYPSASPDAQAELQGLCPDGVAENNLESQNGLFPEVVQEGLVVQRHSVAKSKTDSCPDVCMSQAEGQTCREGEMEDIIRPHCSSAQQWSSSTEEAQHAVQDHPSVRRLNFDVETKVGDSFEEEEHPHIAKEKSNSIAARRTLKPFETLSSTKEEIRNESSHSQEHIQLLRPKLQATSDLVHPLTSPDSCAPESPKTRLRSRIHLSVSKEQQTARGVDPRQLHTKRPGPKESSPNHPLKRSHSSDLISHISPKKASLSSNEEASGNSEETCSFGDTSEAPALETNITLQSSTLSFYSTPPVSFSGEAKKVDCVHLGHVEEGKDCSPTCFSQEREDGKDGASQECEVPLSPSKAHISISNSPGRDFIQILTDDQEETQQREGKTALGSKIVDSPHPRPMLRGHHNDHHGEGEGFMSSLERQDDKDRSPDMHKSVKLRRGVKRGKEQKKNVVRDLPKESLNVTSGEDRGDVRSGQKKRGRKYTASPQLTNTGPQKPCDLRSAVGKSGQEFESKSESKGRGCRRKDPQLRRPFITKISSAMAEEIPESMSQSSLDFSDGKSSNRSTENSDCRSIKNISTNPNSSQAVDQGKDASNFSDGELDIRRCTSALPEESSRSSNHSPCCDKAIITTENEEDSAGITKSDTPIKGKRSQCLRNGRQTCESRKTSSSSGTDVDPLLNPRECLLVEWKTKGALDGASALSGMTVESKAFQESEPASQMEVGRLRRRARNHNRTVQGARKDGQFVKESIENELTVDRELDSMAGKSRDDNSCNNMDRHVAVIEEPATHGDLQQPATIPGVWPVRRRAGHPPKARPQDDLQKPILNSSDLTSDSLSHVSARRSREVCQTTTNTNISVTETTKSQEQTVSQDTEHSRLSCKIEMGTSEEGAQVKEVCLDLNRTLQKQDDSRSQVRPRKHTRMLVRSRREGRRGKGEEGATKDISSPASKDKTPVNECDANYVEEQEEFVSGKMCKLTENEIPQEKRGRKFKKRVWIRKGEDSQKRKGRRWCRAGCETKEDVTNTEEQLEGSSSSEKPGRGSLPTRLLRSYSCPEIPCLSLDRTWTSPLLPSTPHTRLHPSPLQHCPPVHLPPSAKRARRHTVCSLEVEREIAPLCLRKEVYPTGRGGLYCNPTTSVSFTSFTALASFFLSSPLAFLSRKHEGSSESSSASGSSSSSRDVALSSSSSDATPSSSSPVTSLAHHLFTGSTSCILPRSSQSTASVSSFCSVSSQIPLDGESEVKQQVEEGERSCFTPELEARETRDEKSLSDSEIKGGSAKAGERGKQVSRIKIRKTPPKPPTNLTPMGLPRPVRLKKKEFSLEEIYTNKNFRKPPEGRLETIFEMPVSSRDGTLSLIGQRRLKRLVEFPELGVARKPSRHLAGAGKATSQKTGGGSVFGRTRRGGGPKAKEGHSQTLEELDSLLCSKLDQLDAWVAFDQEDPSVV